MSGQNQEIYYPPKSYYLSYTGQGGGKLEPPPPGYGHHDDGDSAGGGAVRASMTAREILHTQQQRKQQQDGLAPSAVAPIAGEWRLNNHYHWLSMRAKGKARFHHETQLLTAARGQLTQLEWVPFVPNRQGLTSRTRSSASARRKLKVSTPPAQGHAPH